MEQCIITYCNTVAAPPYPRAHRPEGSNQIIQYIRRQLLRRKKKSFENYFFLAKWDVHKSEKESSCKMFSLKAVHTAGFWKNTFKAENSLKSVYSCEKILQMSTLKKIIWMLFEKYFEKCAQLWENTPLQEMSDTSVHCRHPEIFHSYILWIINLITFFFKCS